MQSTDNHDQSRGHEGGPLLDAPIVREADSARAQVRLEQRHQGWEDLPHGGVLMSMVLELAHRGLAPGMFVAENYPIRAEFRLGGPPLSMPDTVQVSIQRDGTHVRGRIVREGEEAPSLETGISPSRSADEAPAIDLERVARAMEGIGREAGDRAVPLPFSRNCFVCGNERTQPGLKRKFHCIDRNETRIVFTYLGLDPDDRNLLEHFCLEDGLVHPGSLIAILDETLGWSGFVETRQGGVTVKLEVDILRPVNPVEKMLFFGFCTGARGKDPNRQFWYSEGGLFPMGEEDPSPIMTARGQWLTVPKLTKEMRRHLMPREWTERWLGQDCC